MRRKWSGGGETSHSATRRRIAADGRLRSRTARKKSGNMLIENLLWCGGWVRVGADIYTTAMPILGPTFAFELAVAGTDSIRVNAKAAGKFTSAWKTVPGAKIVAKNSEHDLGHQLAVNGNLTAGSKPESHGWPRVSL